MDISREAEKDNPLEAGQVKFYQNIIWKLKEPLRVGRF